MLARSDAARAIGAKRSAKRARIASRAARIKKVHRRKPWSLGERLRNLTPDFMDVRRRNCSIARHFRHWVAG
ncbi:hypothetical protein, partial [Burkholderia pseudomallei]|uniref:hypothetical protein n=1 Tax=Burkholderia pseudomallei TaxID=28450 RepID=UPI001E4383A5